MPTETRPAKHQDASAESVAALAVLASNRQVLQELADVREQLDAICAAIGGPLKGMEAETGPAERDGQGRPVMTASVADRPVDRHVRRPQGTGDHAWCACGAPWPCPRSYEGRWQALRDSVARLRSYTEKALDDSEITDWAEGRRDAYDAVLAMMTELDARDG